MRKQLRAQLRAKQAELRALLKAAVTDKGEVRDLNADESTQSDAILAAIARINERLDALEVAGDEPAERSAGPDDEQTDAEAETDEDLDDEERSANPAPARRGAAAIPARRSQPLEGRAPAIRTKPRPYSIMRALRMALAGQALNGLEGELSQDIARRTNRTPDGFFMPLGNEEEYRGLILGSETRADLTTTTGAGSIFTAAQMPFIDLLRNNLILEKLGATVLSGMNGKFAIPRQNSTGGASWLTEGSSLTPAAGGIDQVPFTNKTLAAACTLTRKFISQTSIDAEGFGRRDLAQSLAVEMDRAGINGSGSGATPLGLLQNTAIQTLSAGAALGTNGGAPTNDAIIALESIVSQANALGVAPKYLTNPLGRGKLKRVPKIGSTFPVFLWGDGPGNGVGEINGYEAYASTNVPSNLTKGSGTGLSPLIFGNWNDLVIATFGGIDVVVNPYTPQLSGGVTISMFMEADVNVRHNESFAFFSDMVTT